MSSKQELRSVETRRAILAAAGKLFVERGYHVVTMREIAKEAECSHTTIYIYFKDKESLLHQLSMPALQQCKLNMVGVLFQASLSPESKLKMVSLDFVRFCLLNRNMGIILFGSPDDRNVGDSAREIDAMRSEVFAMLQRALQTSVGMRLDDAQSGMYADMYFFMLRGMIHAHASSEEAPDAVMVRLKPVIEEACEVLLSGIRNKLQVRQMVAT